MSPRQPRSPDRRGAPAPGFPILTRVLAACALAACAGADDRTLLGAAGTLPSEAADAPACLGSSRAALSTLERAVVGSPRSYDSDPEIGAAERILSSSQRARRSVAWRIAARVLSATPLSPELEPAPATALPAWQTWHARDDLTRIFRHLYPRLSAAERAARAPFSGEALDAAWAWNDGAARDSEDFHARRLALYQSALEHAGGVAGIGGIYRVAYSPAASRHLLESYPEILDCEPAQLSGVSPASPCSGEDHRPACLRAEFPADAVLVKASWRRAGVGTSLPVFDTSGEALSRRLSASGGFSWDRADAEADPPSDAIYTSRLSSGNIFRLAGLHIMSKELDHWFWITLWWSPNADSDFGADRPPDFPSSFANYKMCSTVAFVEGDPDPSGGFARDLPTLAAALEATHAGVGGPSWCSNPYLEVGAGNAATNCIGCHQHAGTSTPTEDILGDAENFPEFGRTPQRSLFPTDYVFAPTHGENLGAMYRETEEHYR